MTESEFHDRVDSTLQQIEERLDDAESDIDYLISGGVLTIKCENRSQIIFTRQTPVLQLWLATKDGGFHFDYDATSNQWLRDSDQTPLVDMLNHAYVTQTGEELKFEV
ncbi:iron donor protein CyaY [Neptunomonas antarctica]|uniref:Iron-sulfur cluster assembly protein CyaY n=1 Tax=Neptunomonas antarctica TaxID=619304 RepID=A0A1N7J0Z1_9GAMM|nr:iron donor protein CyaY [Neptunomonas antarctica]SIS42954.1 CyaY protein [Neptunomonas antarctica]